MTITTLTLILALVEPAPAVELPSEVVVRPGRLATLKARTTGKLVRWVLASDEADLVPFPDGKTALFCSPTPGRYVVFAWTAIDGVPSEAARCVVVVAEPIPAGELATDLARLLAADPSPERAAHVVKLAAVYREAAGLADQPDVRTAADLSTRIRTAVAARLPPEALVPLRKRIAVEIANVLPLDGQRELDPVTRKSAVSLFDHIATVLESLK